MTVEAEDMEVLSCRHIAASRCTLTCGLGPLSSQVKHYTFGNVDSGLDVRSYVSPFQLL